MSAQLKQMPMLFQKHSVIRFRLKPKIDSPAKTLQILRNRKIKTLTLVQGHKGVTVTLKIQRSNNPTIWINRTIILKDIRNSAQKMLNPLLYLTGLIQVAINFRRSHTSTRITSLIRESALRLITTIKSGVSTRIINLTRAITRAISLIKRRNDALMR